MLPFIFGLAAGYVAFTPKGRDMGNRIADMATSRIKKVVEDVKAAATNETDTMPESKPTEPPRYSDSAD